MSSPNVPDPYVALGVDKDATQQQIKTTYRKLALKFHPDKVTDESLKAAASDNFHKIQQAYEILGDEERKSRYDAQVRLAELRRDVLEKQGHAARSDVRTAAFEVPTQTPGRTMFTARGPERTAADDRRPPSYDSYDDYFGRTATRKDPEYERSARKYSGKGESEKTRVHTREKEKENVKSARSANSKTTTKERRRDRIDKQLIDDETESEDEPYARFDKRREDERERDAYSQRRTKEYTSQYDYHSEAQRMNDQADGVREYIRNSHQKSADGGRPPIPRMSTERDAYLERHRPEKRPDLGARRSSARPSSSGQEKRRDRDREGRKYSAPEMEVPEGKTARRPATLEKLRSSPADIHVSSEPRRRETYNPKYEEKDFVPPSLPRSQTMPVGVGGVSRSRKESTPHGSSKLRNNTYGRPPTPPTTSPEYSSPEEDLPAFRHQTTSNGRPTIFREPESYSRSTRRSPPPAPEIVDRKGRPASSRHAPAAPPPIRTNGEKFAYTSSPPIDSAIDMSGVRLPPRPSPVTRHASEQVHSLYGEVPTTSTPKDTVPMTPGGSRRVTAYQYPEISSRDRDRERERERDYFPSPRVDRERERDSDRRDRDRESGRDRDREREREAVKYKYASPDPDDYKYAKKAEQEIKMTSGYGRDSVRRGSERRPGMSTRVPSSAH